MTPCPRCGGSNVAGARFCSRCGVILSKVQGAAKTESAIDPASPKRPLPPTLRNIPPLTARDVAVGPVRRPPTDDSHLAESHALRNVAVAAAVGLSIAYFLWRRPAEERPAPIAAARPAPSSAAPVAAAPVPEVPSGLAPADVDFLNALSQRMAASPLAAPDDQDLARLDRICSENALDEKLKPFAVHLYLRRARRDMSEGNLTLADQRLASARLVDDQNPAISGFEAGLRLRQNDWQAAVTAVGRYEALSGPPSAQVTVMLAIALDKLERRAEIEPVLERPVFAACPTATEPADVEACNVAAQIRQNLRLASSAPAMVIAPSPARETLATDPSKDTIQSDKFAVRFDGESQNGVARDVLFVLDRAYARLAANYVERPQSKIPVVLHSAQDYYSKTGAPWWSGGSYSSHNGSIQIPLRGMPRTLPPEMEDTLIHELSHAFVDDMSGGNAGRELQEGLAQYMEGHRIESEMSPATLREIARGGRRDVMSFYMLSLAIAQQMMQSRGQGGVNTLLRTMKEKGSEEAAYRSVFGRSKTDVHRDILETFWRRYS